MIRRALFAGVLLGMMGCATARQPAADAPETVGALSASYRSIAVAPVHADTDLTPSFGAVDTDEAAPATVSAAADAGGDAELPDIAAKDQGLKAGEAR